MLDRIKIALRISHNKLDDEISSTIEVAKSELIRLGISSSMINSDDNLINEAIKTYCLFSFADDEKRADGYFKSWSYQIDNLRKTYSYTGGDTDV